MRETIAMVIALLFLIAIFTDPKDIGSWYGKIVAGYHSALEEAADE